MVFTTNKEKGNSGLVAAIAYYGFKGYTISLPLNDIDKREALKKKTGFDVTVALANLQKEKEEEEVTSTQSDAKVRRVQPEATTTTRRTVPKYNVVKTEEPDATLGK